MKVNMQKTGYLEEGAVEIQGEITNQVEEVKYLRSQYQLMLDQRE